MSVVPRKSESADVSPLSESRPTDEGDHDTTTAPDQLVFNDSESNENALLQEAGSTENIQDTSVDDDEDNRSRTLCGVKWWRPRDADGHINLLDALMIMCTWSTSSSNVLYPFTFGVLGVIGGPIFMFIAFFINWVITRWTVTVAQTLDVETFGDLGYALLGKGGRIVFAGSQILFQQLFLPVAIVLCVGAVQSISGGVGFTSCNGSMTVVFILVAFALIQVSREFEKVTAIAYVSCGLMALMTLAIVIEVMTQPGPPGVIPNVNNSQVELFVGMGNHPERYHWANVLAAVGIFVYSCLPNCIVVETMATLRPEDRPHMVHAIDGSFIAYVTVYLIAGVPAVLRWGGDLAEPLAVSNSVAGVFVKLVLIFGTLLDFVLAATTVNRWAMRLFDPGFDYEWTLKNGLQWAKVSLPSSIVAVCMALLIPRLESLTGLLNSIAGATLQITAIPLCLWVSKTPRAREGVWFPDLTGQFIAGTIYGVVFTLTVFLAAVYSISQTDYIPQGNQTFWCDIVG